MIEDAVTLIGLSYKEFLGMTMYQYRLCVEQYRFKQAKASEHTRLICYHIYSALTPENKRVSIQEYQPLYTDVLIDEEPQKETSKEDIIRITELSKQRLAALGHLTTSN
jgi:hypothetical protein